MPLTTTTGDRSTAPRAGVRYDRDTTRIVVTYTERLFIIYHSLFMCGLLTSGSANAEIARVGVIAPFKVIQGQ